MNDEQILIEEMRAIDTAIAALRAAAHAHGMHQEHFDEAWMDDLDKMIIQLRHRTNDCYRTQRSMAGLAVPAVSH